MHVMNNKMKDTRIRIHMQINLYEIGDMEKYIVKRNNVSIVMIEYKI